MSTSPTEMNWQTEIEDLHAFFESYFLGTADSLARVEAALAADFSIVGPTGVESNRDETLAALKAGHGHATSMRIWVTDCCVIHHHDPVLIASYIEHQELDSGRTTKRRSTVVFSSDATGPNGLQWQRVHETWIPSTA